VSKVSVLRPHELKPAQVSAWRDLQKSEPWFRNPFLSPDFTIAVGRVRPAARVAVLEEGGDVVAVFPFERGRLGNGRPIGAGLCDYQGLVHAPGFQWKADELLARCGLVTWDFDHVLADQTPFAPYHSTRHYSPVIDLSKGYEAYLRGRVGATNGSAKQILRKQRKLEREVGPLRLEFDVRDRAKLLMVMRWKSAQYQRMRWPDRFAHRSIRALVTDLFQTRTAECSGTLSVLYAGGEPVAGHFGLRSEFVLSSWFPTFDQAFSSYSPGLVLHLRIAAGAAAEGIQQFDLGKGSERYKQALKNGEIPIAEGLAYRRNALAMLRRAQRACNGSLVELVSREPSVHRVAGATLRRLSRLRFMQGDTNEWKDELE
jgi:CelD/BcsL family acetyltransferase involved in cellulose biosynthesis